MLYGRQSFVGQMTPRFMCRKTLSGRGMGSKDFVGTGRLWKIGLLGTQLVLIWSSVEGVFEAVTYRMSKRP